MKKIQYAVDADGKVAAVILVDGDSVMIQSENTAIKRLTEKSLKRKVPHETKDIIADGYEMVSPGKQGYSDAVIDTLEEMGLDVVS